MTTTPHELRSGHHKVLITDEGCGQTFWDWVALNRWPADPVEDEHGFFVYLRDLHDGRLWSAGLKPVVTPNSRYRVQRCEDRMIIDRHENEIESSMVVSVGEDAEVRRVTLRNVSNRPRHIQLTSAIEVALAHPAGDLGHPAFSKLFVQTEVMCGGNALMARRRPRSAGESWPVMFHAMIGADVDACETDRVRFMGRGRNASDPAMQMTNNAGNVLDPVFALSTSFVLQAGEAKEITLLLGAAAGRHAVEKTLEGRQVIGRGTALRPDEFKPLPDSKMDEVIERALAKNCGAFSKAGDEYRIPVIALDWRTMIKRSFFSRPAPRPDIDLVEPPLGPDDFFDGEERPRWILGDVLKTALSGREDDVVNAPSGVEAPARRSSHLRLPPMPWCNVIANERFGFLVSEKGSACTWARNSQANRLTPWSNDPVCDPHGEALYLRDDDSKMFWSPLPGPCAASPFFMTSHGFGYSRFHLVEDGLSHETLMFVPRHDPVKIVKVKLSNRGSRLRRLSLFSYQRLVLGTLPEGPGSVHTWGDGLETLFAQRNRPNEFSDGIAFCFGVLKGARVETVKATTNRRSFIGEHGSVRSPAAVRAGLLDNSDSHDEDKCFAWQWSFALQPGETLVACIVLGEGLGQEEVDALRKRYASIASIDEAFDDVRDFWASSLRRVRVQTPVPEIDAMVNGWLAYQALSSRVWGRTAFYQSSGAFGFRDQLQDAGNLTLLWPELARAQLLLHARHQFVEGDVLHWWHDAPVERGVRTRFADDLLWLPFVACHYVRTTADDAVWDEDVSFLSAPLLKPGEEEQYLKPDVSEESASLYEHCCRAVERSLATGLHGLPLMGTGDWNDGMNRVGREGRGESVWMGFFLFAILRDFIPVAKQRGDDARAERYEHHCGKLSLALDDAGWDGAWYRRAYFDDGTPLGTQEANECRIDGLAQAWSVLSGAVSGERAVRAMAAAELQLVDEDAGLIRLLTPPFVSMPHDPGYIKGYVAGVRENGGQYTHAACWMIAAAAKLGRRDIAAKWLAMLSPLAHSQRNPDGYKVEPYVMAADVYGAEPHVGRGGWTWYTGSAGWAFRVAVESVLGLRVERGDTLVLKPCVPDDWPEFVIEYTHPKLGTRFVVEVKNPSLCSAKLISATLDDEPILLQNGDARVPILSDGREHRVVLILGEGVTSVP